MSASGITREAILDARQIQSLRDALAGRPVVACFGAGVDSTAMLVALREAGIRPDVITFANTGGEKPETIAHVDLMNGVLEEWGWPRVSVCAKRPLEKTGYTDLFGNCYANETLPSIAFGMKSCSVKWKQIPQDQFLKGVKSGPNAAPPHPAWERAVATGQRIVKLIGYDCGPADTRRSKRLTGSDGDFDYFYPLQAIGWAREHCVGAIAAAIGPPAVPVKSACFFCSASKQWELYWLAAYHPELFERALDLERRALTGKHSRFSEVGFGATWEELIRSADRFPSSNTTVGLGRSFAWNHWARVRGVVDEEGRVRRSPQDRANFIARAEKGTGADNALDRRAVAGAHVP